MLNLDFEWLTTGNDSPEIRQTMGMFGLKVGEISLTENEDIWSQTIRETVLVSAYPIAAWIASSWWRLMFEPLPSVGIKPSVDWRMSHELAAANQGFIWPRVIFASDTESMQIWSTPSNARDKQSVRYINGLEQPILVDHHEFEQKILEFIETVISRLDATKVRDTPLVNLWDEVKEERSDPYSSNYRRREAELGFDPDDCPEDRVKDALHLAENIGDKTFSELAPTFRSDLSEMNWLEEISYRLGVGLLGNPQISPADSVAKRDSKAPWQWAKQAAINLRKQIDIGEDPISDEKLCDMLGLKKDRYDNWVPFKGQSASVAVPHGMHGLEFHPRKRHPVARRFELARFIGDYLLYGNRGESWLASTDFRTSRQKYQRAFAAEFLCPLNNLQAYLKDDYSESSIEDAAVHFGVSSQTVESILLNNNLISLPQSIKYLETSLPY